MFSALIQSVARNPSMAKQLFGYAILGLALTEAEAIALFALMMAFLLLLLFFNLPVMNNNYIVLFVNPTAADLKFMLSSSDSVSL